MASRPVVLYDAYPHSYTGTARTVHLLARHLPAHGFSTEVVLPAGGAVADALRADGIEPVIVEAPPSLARFGGRTRGRSAVEALRDLPGYWRRLARRLPPGGALFVTSQRSVLMAAPAARRSRTKVLWQVSGVDEPRMVSMVCGALASSVVAISPAARPPGRRRSVPIVPPPLHPRFESAPPAEPGPAPLVVSVGRLDPVKRHDLLLDAFGLLLDRFPHVRLRIIGDTQVGHEEHGARIRSRAASFPGGSVEVVGGVERPEALMRDAWVYASSSAHEGLGLAIAEAMACRIPVVFTAPTGLAHWVEDGVSARVVPGGDPRALASAIADLIEDRAGAERQAAAGRRAVEALFADAVVAQTAGHLDQLMGGRP